MRLIYAHYLAFIGRLESRILVTRYLVTLWFGLMFLSHQQEREIAVREIRALFKLLIAHCEAKERIALQIRMACREVEERHHVR